MSKLSIKDIVIKVECLEEDVEVRGNAIASGNEFIDRFIENKILKELAQGNQWSWCCVKVTASIPGIDLEGVSILGACSYENEEEFLKDLNYLTMKHEAQAELLHKVEAVKALEIA